MEHIENPAEYDDKKMLSFSMKLIDLADNFLYYYGDIAKYRGDIFDLMNRILDLNQKILEDINKNYNNQNISNN